MKIDLEELSEWSLPSNLTEQNGLIGTCSDIWTGFDLQIVVLETPTMSQTPLIDSEDTCPRFQVEWIDCDRPSWIGQNQICPGPQTVSTDVASTYLIILNEWIRLYQQNHLKFLIARIDLPDKW